MISSSISSIIINSLCFLFFSNSFTTAQVEKQERFVSSQQMEEEKLRRIVVDADTERQRQQKELEAVVAERDILGTQVCA